MDKNEKYIKKNIVKMIEWEGGNGEGCIARNKITKEGYKVGFMYREEPSDKMPDNGWRFLAGIEDEEYMNDPNNHSIFYINTICNYDKDIIPYLNSEVGSDIRVDGNSFEIDDGTKNIFVEKQIENN